MSLKIRGLLAVSIGTILGLSLGLGSAVLADRESPERVGLPWEQARLLAEVLERVKRDYVDEVDDDRLIEAAIRGMVSNLDPHSSYLDPEEYEEIRISTSGNYSGVGLEVGAAEGQMVVVSAIEGSPAAAAGVHSGDVIISIDSMPVDPMNLDDAILRLRGTAGTPVRLTLTRDGGQTPVAMDLVRTRIELKSVRYELVESSYGYVRLSQFSETTAGDMRDAVAEMTRQSGGQLSGLILDLRNNPGGVLDAAVEVSDAFLDEGLIVTADGRVPDARFRMEARPGDIIGGKPMAVIVNGGSASASEIVAGALQDNHRAVIVGVTTFGKGSVQTVMPLSDGRAVKLTTSRYFTPSGRSIHNRGIVPDIRIDPVAATASAESDYQLSRALELLKTQRVATIRQGH
jgi:carboxyl-terminal processing protease